MAGSNFASTCCPTAGGGVGVGVGVVSVAGAGSAAGVGSGVGIGVAAGGGFTGAVDRPVGVLGGADGGAVSVPTCFDCTGQAMSDHHTQCVPKSVDS